MIGELRVTEFGNAGEDVVKGEAGRTRGGCGGRRGEARGEGERGREALEEARERIGGVG